MPEKHKKGKILVGFDMVPNFVDDQERLVTTMTMKKNIDWLFHSLSPDILGRRLKIEVNSFGRIKLTNSTYLHLSALSN